MRSVCVVRWIIGGLEDPMVVVTSVPEAGDMFMEEILEFRGYMRLVWQ